MRRLLQIIAVLVIFSTCKKEEEPLVLTAADVELESANISGAKVLFSTYADGLYAVGADNSIYPVTLNYNVEQHAQFTGREQIYPFDKNLFVVSYESLKKTYLIDKTNGKASRIHNVPMLDHRWYDKGFALTGLTVYYIDEDYDLYKIPNFSKIDTAVQQINTDGDPIWHIELGSDGTLLAYKGSNNTGLDYHIIHPNGDEGGIEYSLSLWTDLDGYINYTTRDGIFSIAHGAIKEVFTGSPYEVNYLAGIWKDNDNEVLLGAGSHYLVDLTQVGSYLNFNDTVGFTGYTCMACNNHTAYIFITPVVWDVQWDTRPVEKPVLLVVNTQDMSYTLHKLEIDRVIEQAFYSDGDVVLVKLGSTFPAHQDAYTPNAAIFNISTLQISTVADVNIEGAIYFEDFVGNW